MDAVSLRRCPHCREEMRICFTGRKWKITCDTPDCPTRDCYGKSIEEVTEKWQGKPFKLARNSK